MAEGEKRIWTVPNVLTMIRMALLPVYWAVFMSGRVYAALGIFLLASATDIADGYIARKYNQITDFGKLMDPLADKLMTLSVMLSLAIRGMAPWPALLILCLKEALMVLGGALLYKRGVVVYAKKIGKYAQVLVVTGLLLCFFGPWLTEHLGFPLHAVIVWCSVALTVCALVFYAVSAVRMLREKKKEGSSPAGK